MATPNLALPELVDGQTGAETTHNLALREVDVLLQGLVIDRDLTTPPGSPLAGDTYIPKATATGVWTGHEDDIAWFDGSAWQFKTPNEGWVFRVDDEDVRVEFDGATWGAPAGSEWFVNGSGELVPRVSRTVAPNTDGDDLGTAALQWGTVFVSTRVELAEAADIRFGAAASGTITRATSGATTTGVRVGGVSAMVVIFGPTGDIGAYAGAFNYRTAGAAPHVWTTDGTLGVLGLNGTERMRIDAAGRLAVPTVGSSAGVLVGGDVLLTRAAADVLALGAGDRLGVDGDNASIETGRVTATTINDASAGTDLLTKGSDDQEQAYTFEHDGTPANYSHKIDLDKTGAREGDVFRIRIDVNGDGVRTIEVLIRNGSAGSTLRSFPSGNGSADRYGVFVFDGANWITRTWHTVDA